MADWRNRMEQITNKVKHQLNAKGVDSIAQLRGVFDVSWGAEDPFSRCF